MSLQSGFGFVLVLTLVEYLMSVVYIQVRMDSFSIEI